MKGALLINLGSPNSPNAKDVKKYLDEFLMDERVIDYPYILRTLLVRGIILNTRPKKSAAAYRKVWTEEGSPLIVISEKLAQKVSQNAQIPVSLGMRYGRPSIEDGIRELHEQGVTEIFIIPLYPQYAMSTTETVEVKVQEVVKAKFSGIKVDSLLPFYNHPDYIKVLAESMRSQADLSQFDKILFSYHGVPERHIYKTDPTKSHCKIDGSCCDTPSAAHEKCYRHQCLGTTKAVCEALDIPQSQQSLCFQSRLGRDKWLEPYTDETLERLAEGEDSKKIAVVTPAFVADCLETIEEIGMEGKEEFLHNGGEEFVRLDCLNDDDAWANLLSNWINEWNNNQFDNAKNIV